MSDRLLTRKWTTPRVRYEPWDEAANKSVIVLGSDGLFAMGYSGPGHIAGAPTDSWIAEVVAGEELDANQARPDFGAIQISQGTSTDRVLATRFYELAQRVDEAGRAGQLTQSLSIGFVGLRWKDLNKLAWPAYGRIGWDEDQARYGYEMSPQRWGYGQGKFVTGATGPSRKLPRRCCVARQVALVGRTYFLGLAHTELAQCRRIALQNRLTPRTPALG